MTKNKPAIESMSLDAAIAHADERASALSGPCAEQHAQLASWLRELQESRKTAAGIGVNGEWDMCNTPAAWNLTLNVECPECEEYFDLTKHDDFWVDARFGACEHGTLATRGVDVECPECHHEFKVDFEY